MAIAARPGYCGEAGRAQANQYGRHQQKNRNSSHNVHNHACIYTGDSNLVLQYQRRI